MVSYKIEIKPSAEKELEKLPRQMIPRIVATIKGLAENPYPYGVKNWLVLNVHIAYALGIIVSCMTSFKRS